MTSRDTNKDTCLGTGTRISKEAFVNVYFLGGPEKFMVKFSQDIQ
jgi:hypothetical protein